MLSATVPASGPSVMLKLNLVESGKSVAASAVINIVPLKGEGLPSV